MLRLPFLTSAVLLFAAAPSEPPEVRADGAPSDSARADTARVLIEGLEIFGTRPVTTRGGSSETRASVDSLGLPAATSADQILKRLPAIHVRTNSRGEAELSVRGSESRQVAVLFDGMPLTMSWDGRTDLSVIPSGALRQVTLARGLSTLLAGPNVLGGVVEFESAAAGGPVAAPTLSVHSSADHVGGYGASASMSVPRDLGAGRMTLRAGAGHRDSPGVPLASGIVEPLPDRDLRVNTDVAETDAFASARYDAAGGSWVSLATTGFRAERGIAAELNADDPRFWRYPYVARALTVLSGGSGVRRAPWGGETSIRASAGLDVGRTEIDAYDSRAYDTIDSREDGDQRTFSVRAIGTQTLGRRADLRIGVTSSELTYDEHLSPGGTSRYRHRLWSVAGETTLRFPAHGTGPFEEVDVSAGGAFDRSTYPLSGGKSALGPRNEWGGRAGVSALLMDGHMTLHASGSRRARFPSLRELYSGALGRFDPNPGLRPEALTAFEGGVTLRGTRGTVQIVGFHQRLSDAVVRIRVGSLFRRVNQEGLHSTGVELAGSRRMGRVTLGAGLVGQSVRLLDPDAGLERPENVPEWSGSVHGEVTLPAGFKAGTLGRFVGEQYAIDPDAGTLATLPAVATLDLEVSRAWRLSAGWLSSLRTRIAAENVTGEAVYDAYGLPGPGRTFRIDVRMN